MHELSSFVARKAAMKCWDTQPLGLDLALGVQIAGELPERNGRTGFEEAARASTLSCFGGGARRHRCLRCRRSMEHEP